MVEKAKNKILITGVEGMLGGALFQELAKHYPAIGTSQRILDITDAKKVKQVILDNKPWIVIHIAAMTDVDGCEDAPELAYNVNALGTRNVARASKSAGAILIYLSTDYVFDGTKGEPYAENSNTNPISVYGRTKLDGEIFVAEELDSFIIIRSSWLFGEGKIGFVEKIIEQAKTKKIVSVVADKYGSPTYVNDLAQAIGKLISLIENRQFIPQRSTFHITNSEFCSWFEYAGKIIEFAKIEGAVLKPISSKEFVSKAKRPKFSVLDNTHYNELTGRPLRPWREALGEYLQCSRN